MDWSQEEDALMADDQFSENDEEEGKDREIEFWTDYK